MFKNSYIAFVFLILLINFQNPIYAKIKSVIIILMFLKIILDYLVKKEFKIKFIDKEFYWMSILVLLVLISFFRNNREDISLISILNKTIVFAMFYYSQLVLVKSKYLEGSLEKKITYFIYNPLLLFVIVNFILLILTGGDSFFKTGDSIMLSKMGFSIPRQSFPLSVGVNAYGSFLGIVFTLSLVGYLCLQQYKKKFIIGGIFCFASLLLTDSRGPVLYSIVVFLLFRFYYAKAKAPKLIKLIPLIGFFGPFLILGILSILSSTEYATELSRSGENLKTGNSRSIIWAISYVKFFSLDLINQFFGYGEYGHYAAGASRLYKFIFESYSQSEIIYMHPHNTYISILFDYGYLGMSIYLFFQYKVISIIKCYWNKYHSLACLLLANLLYFNLVGIGETMFGLYYQNVLYAFFAINIFAFLISYKTKTDELVKDKSEYYENKTIRA